MNNRLLLLALITAFSFPLFAQKTPEKIRHAEPVYTDLIRDLGARKGEREWNLGGQLAPGRSFLAHSGFVEYEFAPVNRLGLEVELPFTCYSPIGGEQPGDIPRSRIEGLKLAAQYTFIVAPSRGLSVAAAYQHEFRAHSFYTIRNQSRYMKGHSYSPVLIAARRLGSHFHSLIYTGPQWMQTINEHRLLFQYQVNASVHYMLPGSGSFIGLEVNQAYGSHETSVVIRPQARLVLSRSVAVGIATGIPLSFSQEGIGCMFRLVYEPGR